MKLLTFCFLSPPTRSLLTTLGAAEVRGFKVLITLQLLPHPQHLAGGLRRGKQSLRSWLTLQCHLGIDTMRVVLVYYADWIMQLVQVQGLEADA